MIQLDGGHAARRYPAQLKQKISESADAPVSSTISRARRVGQTQRQAGKAGWTRTAH